MREATWFHATSEKNWDQILQRKRALEVHAGTENAAFDRALGVYLTRDGLNESFELYELRLKPEVTIAPRVIHDANSESVRLPRFDVTRYINRWEDPASISLAARSSAFELVRSRTVSAGEARERISIYNVQLRR